jgi:hypothetical protein
MALDTYSGLLAALATFSIRSDQTAVWPDCVTLAQVQIDREFAKAVGEEGRRIRPMLARTTFTVDSEFETLPADFVGAVALEITSTTPSVRLDYLDPVNVAQRRGEADAVRSDLSALFATSPAPPSAYSVVGSDFQFFPAPEAGSSYTAALTYWQKIPALSEANPTNWLLTAAPDAYLYGALCEFGARTEDQRLDAWAQRFASAVEAVKTGYPTETEGSTLRTEFPLRRCW